MTWDRRTHLAGEFVSPRQHCTRCDAVLVDYAAEAGLSSPPIPTVLADGSPGPHLVAAWPLGNAVTEYSGGKWRVGDDGPACTEVPALEAPTGQGLAPPCERRRAARTAKTVLPVRHPESLAAAIRLYPYGQDRLSEELHLTREQVTRMARGEMKEMRLDVATRLARAAFLCAIDSPAGEVKHLLRAKRPVRPLERRNRFEMYFRVLGALGRAANGAALKFVEFEVVGQAVAAVPEGPIEVVGNLLIPRLDG